MGHPHTHRDSHISTEIPVVENVVTLDAEVETTITQRTPWEDATVTTTTECGEDNHGNGRLRRKRIRISESDSGVDDAKVFKCTWDGCTTIYKVADSLDAHLREHRHAEKPFACVLQGCTRRFWSEVGRGCHKKFAHRLHPDTARETDVESRNNFDDRAEECRCVECSKRYADVGEIANDKRLVCGLGDCTERSSIPIEQSSYRDSKQHAVCNDTENECLCAGCSKWHAPKYKQIIVERPYTCGLDGCTKSFSCSYGRDSHQISTHSSIVDVLGGVSPCIPCETDSESDVDAGDRNYECMWVGCSKRYSSHRALDNHMAVHARRELPHECRLEGCGKRFETALKLNCHLIKAHNIPGERPEDTRVHAETRSDRLIFQPPLPKVKVERVFEFIGRTSRWPVTCNVPDCDTVLKNWLAMNQHHKDTHGGSTCRWMGCGLIYPHGMWEDHYTMFHSKSPNRCWYAPKCKFVCELTGEGVWSDETIQTHYTKNHRGVYACQKEGCSAIMPTENQRLTHLLTCAFGGI